MQILCLILSTVVKSRSEQCTSDMQTQRKSWNMVQTNVAKSTIGGRSPVGRFCKVFAGNSKASLKLVPRMEFSLSGSQL